MPTCARPSPASTSPARCTTPTPANASPRQIQFDNDASETRTLVEIETEDRLGLLYVITQTLSELELDISAARILTEKGAAIDTFYVQETGGGKVLSAEHRKAIERRLTHAIARMDAAASAAK